MGANISNTDISEAGDVLFEKIDASAGDSDSERKNDTGLEPSSSSSDEEREPKVMIYLETLSGDTLKIKIRLSDTVEQLKGVIESKTDIPESEQNLIFKKQLLDEVDDCLEDYRLHDGATILMLRKTSTRSEVFVD